MAKTTIPCLINREHRHSKTLIVWCSDPRLRGVALSDFVNGGGFDPYDLICVPGGANIFVSFDSMHCQVAVDQIEILRKLHHFNVVVLVMHEDCGACGGSKAFGHDCQKEQSSLLTKLDIAKKTILAHFHDIHVIRAIVRFNGFEILD